MKLNDAKPPMTTDAVLAGLKANDEWAVQLLSWIEVLDTKVLEAALHGELDLSVLARIALVHRGYIDPTASGIEYLETAYFSS